MPRTVEHIVETHRIAGERRAAGRPVWARRLNVADVWKNPDMTFEQRRDVIVARIKRSHWYTQQDQDSELHIAVWNLGDADEPDDFDYYWDSIYDLADIDRVWIATF